MTGYPCQGDSKTVEEMRYVQDAIRGASGAIIGVQSGLRVETAVHFLQDKGS